MMLLSGTTSFANLAVALVPEKVPAPVEPSALWARAGIGAAARAAPPLLLGAEVPPEAEHAVLARPAPTRAAPAMRSVRNEPWRARAPGARKVRVMHFGRCSPGIWFRYARKWH